MTEPATDWQFTVAEADQRRGRHIVAVVGWQEHSGLRWHRFAAGVAATVYEGRQGYVPEDITEIEKRNGMDPGTGSVIAWMDLVIPPLPIARQSFDYALHCPLRTKEPTPCSE